MSNLREVKDDILKDWLLFREDELDDNFLDYLGYWNEKYYRNGFCDGIELVGSVLNK